MKAAEAMVKCLEQEGISVVFGYPGAAICPFYDALTHSDIRHILVRQEQNAGHAASGYARIKNKPAVCIATSGPGALNLITGIATAYMDSVPMVVITGQVPSDQIGKDVFQEADITGSVEPFIKHSYLIKNASELPKIFKEAFYLAGTGRKGPVLIDVPMDVQNEEIEFKYPERVDIRAYKPTEKGNSLQVKKVAEAIKKAKRPLICAGGGVFSADASKELFAFVEAIGVPVVTTMMGIGSYPSDNPLYLGMIGTHGVKPANYALKESDLLVLIGARVGDRAVKSPEFLEERTKIVHIDIDPAEIGKNIHVDIPVVGNAKLILQQLTAIAEKTNCEEWLHTLSEKKKAEKFDAPKEGFINPKEFLALLSKKAPDSAVCVADVGQNQIWAANHFTVKNGRFLTSGGMGTMGYSVPAALGAKLANPKVQVIAVCGDGSFQMQMMELATVCQHDVSVKIVLMTNKRLGMVCELQKKQYAGNETAVFLDGSPDFTALVKAYGIPAERISSIDDAPAAIDRMLKAKTPYVIECAVSPDESTL